MEKTTRLKENLKKYFKVSSIDAEMLTNYMTKNNCYAVRHPNLKGIAKSLMWLTTHGSSLAAKYIKYKVVANKEITEDDGSIIIAVSTIDYEYTCIVEI